MVPSNTPIVISLTYSADLRDDLMGFYRSSYTENNQTYWIATTQFESTYARAAFPCFDEPLFKANFTLSITCPKDLAALSNMQQVNQIDRGEWKEVHFEPSVRMSTYLVAFVVGRFESTEPADYGNGRQTRVWATPEQIRSGSGEFARDLAVELIKWYESYFDAPYPLDKLDQIAIPD